MSNVYYWYSGNCFIEERQRCNKHQMIPGFFAEGRAEASICVSIYVMIQAIKLRYSVDNGQMVTCVKQVFGRPHDTVPCLCSQRRCVVLAHILHPFKKGSTLGFSPIVQTHGFEMGTSAY